MYKCFVPQERYLLGQGRAMRSLIIRRGADIPLKQSISQKINCARHKYMNTAPPPPQMIKLAMALGYETTLKLHGMGCYTFQTLFFLKLYFLKTFFKIYSYIKVLPNIS